MPADTEVVKTETGAKAASPYALLFELEGAAVQGRQAEYDALQSVLSGHKVKLNPHTFARHCLNINPSVYLSSLIEACGGKGAASAELVEEIKNGVALFLSSDEAILNPVLAQLLSTAHKRGLEHACVTAVKESAVKALLSKWGEPIQSSRVLSVETNGRWYPRSDVWVKAAKTLSRTPRQCIAVVGSHYSMRAALAAGMRCIVIPDSFTSFQDFSGADAVVDNVADLDAAKLLDLLAPAKPFI